MIEVSLAVLRSDGACGGGGGIRLVRFEIGWLRICERFIFDDDGGRVDGGAAKLL